MSKGFRNFIASQWHDVKGNAKWDFIKWSFLACFTIPTGIAILAKWFGSLPWWEAMAIFAGLGILLFLIWCGLIAIILRKPPVASLEVKPIKITPLPPVLVRRVTGATYAVDVEILNENQSVSGVKLRILKAQPKMAAYPDVDLDAIEFPLIGISDRVLHRGQRCRIHLFDTIFTGSINLHFQEGAFLFTPQKQDGKPIEHILILETSADGVDPHTQQFRLLYKMTNSESPVTIEEVQERKLTERKENEKSEPELEMEIIHPVERDVLTSRKTYRIKVKNNDRKKFIKNLRVTISEIKWPRTVEKPIGWSGMIFPYQLPEKGNQNISDNCELAGDSEKEFDLMFIDFHNFTTRLINLAPFQPKNPESPSMYKAVESDNRFHIEGLSKEESRLIFIFKISGGDGDIATITEKYNLKIPQFAPERSTDDAVVNVNAVIRDSDKFLPTFEKIPSDAWPKKENAEETSRAREQLTKFGQLILNRIAIIQRIEPNKYRKDDAETLKIISDAIAYMDFSLKREALLAFEEGVASIHGVFLHPGEPATRYEDDHMEALARLNRRYENLKKIVEEIDKFLK